MICCRFSLKKLGGQEATDNMCINSTDIFISKYSMKFVFIFNSNYCLIMCTESSGNFV